jgi:hypothetical protein
MAWLGEINGSESSSAALMKIWLSYRSVSAKSIGGYQWRKWRWQRNGQRNLSFNANGISESGSSYAMAASAIILICAIWRSWPSACLSAWQWLWLASLWRQYESIENIWQSGPA